mgnify:CR=1 FL=1
MGKNYYPHDIERVAEETEEVELGQVVAYGGVNNETHEEDIVLFRLPEGLLSIRTGEQLRQPLKHRVNGAAFCSKSNRLMPEVSHEHIYSRQ